MDAVTHSTITIMIHDGADRFVDGQLRPVDSKARELSVEAREVAALEQRVIGETDAGDNV